MERRVKERLVGATILVVLIVLIVPELLSGPKRLAPGAPPAAGSTEASRNVVVDLATKKALPETEDAGAAASGAAPGAAPPSADLPNPGGSADAGSAAAVAPDSPLTPNEEAVATAPDPAAPPRAAPPAVATLQPHQPAPLESDTTPVKSTMAGPKTGAAHETVPEAAHHGWAAQLGSFAARANAERLERRLRGEGFSVFLNSSGAGRALRYRVRVGPVADRAAAEKVVAKLKKAGHQASIVAP